MDEHIIDFSAVCVDEVCRNPVFSIAPKGDWIAVERFEDNSTIVQLYDFTSQKELHQLDNFADFVQSIAMSPSSELVAVLDKNGVLRIWDVDFGAQRASRGAEGIETIEFSKDGRFLFGWNSETLKVWSLP